MSNAPRSLRNPRHLGQGTAFHELVVVPTYMPDLTRPYHVPGSDLSVNPPAAALAVEQTRIAAPLRVRLNLTLHTQYIFLLIALLISRSDSDTEKPRLLFVHVTMEWTERGKSTRTNTRTKKMHESKLVATPVDVFSISRVAFIPIALSAQGYDEVYVAGVASGPAMRVFWSGSPGGKGGATAVLYDKDWEILIQKLAKVVKTSKKLDTVSVIFDLETMEGFKQRHKRIHSPGPYESELSYGTRVPNADDCTPAQLALGAAIDEIKAAHSCVEHGTRVSSTVSGYCKAGNPPPKELVASWTGGPSASTSKPRGHGGPYPAQPQPGTSTSAAETTNLLLAMMAQNMATSNRSTPAPFAPPPARSPLPPSSPPPAIEDDLDAFMDAFSRAKNMPEVVIDAAKIGLRDACYTPDILCEPSVTFERLKDLTGLAEGEVHQLKKFARQWSGKIEGKRARRGIEF
ncbi:hypothetical protein C8J57DRAFT_1238803 [Mycena rebaudengoi]|nr:hypothetical protein C8J57DRAFT_1238803 [Mycena rebaudengoi]